MDLRNNNQRGRVAPQRTNQVSSAPAVTAPTSAQSPKKSSKLWWIIGGLVALALLVSAVAYYGFGLGSHVDRSKYQAVFLANGQVYFGKLSGWGGTQPYLTDVYYFQAAGGNTEADAENPEEASNSQTLVKLGEEIHKPTDKLILNSDAILFVENIEDDGQVVEAIKSDQSSED